MKNLKNQIENPIKIGFLSYLVKNGYKQSIFRTLSNNLIDVDITQYLLIYSVSNQLTDDTGNHA
jgi:hypothetical protein